MMYFHVSSMAIRVNFPLQIHVFEYFLVFSCGVKFKFLPFFMQTFVSTFAITIFNHTYTLSYIYIVLEVEFLAVAHTKHIHVSLAHSGG